MSDDALIEAMARALEPDAWFNRENAFADFLDVADEVVRPSIEQATRALAALRKTHAVVPRVPTDAMFEAAYELVEKRSGLWGWDKQVKSPGDLWTAMLNASEATDAK